MGSVQTPRFFGMPNFSSALCSCVGGAGSKSVPDQ